MDEVTHRNSTVWAARIFVLLALVVGAFQAALILGMPWGALTWGGRFRGPLPASMRFVAAVSAVLMAAFAGTVLVRAGIMWPRWRPHAEKFVWFVVAYCGLGVVANAITPSPWERIIWLPIVATMLVCSWLVARS